MSVIDELTSELARLPGIGRKTALRLTYHLLRQPPEQSRRLAEALVSLTERVRQCERCHNLTETPICAICADPRRDAATNPSMEGEATALYVQRQLANRPVRVTRIARGLPVGGDLEYADGVTIAQALSARRDMT